MATVKHERGTRGYDQNDTVCFVARVVEVKGVKGTLYRYWVVDGEDIPGAGPVRLLEIGAFTGFKEVLKKTKPKSEFVKVMIPECEAIPVERRW